MRSRRVRRFAAGALGALAVGLLGLASCRKPAPDEVVYTGARPTAVPTGTGVPTVTAGPDAGAPPDAGPDGATEVEPGGPFTKAALLKATADCALGRYREFEAAARSFQEAARAYAQAPGDASGQSARGAWVAAIASWQQAELFRLGPAARTGEPGAQDLRDQIYAWPLLSRCKIDEQLVAQTYAQPTFASSLINTRGLSAAEYVLFNASSGNACSNFSVINAQGGWAALGADELTRRRAAYAAAIADDVVSRATTLVQAWEPGGGNFHAELAGAGAGSKTYATDQDALNAVSDALFYLEKEVKDLKLGRPIGLIECFTGTCPEAVESPLARVSTAHIRANLAAFRRSFAGCADGVGVGFDDWLRAVGAADLADRMLAALAKAQASADALDPPIEQSIVSDPAKVAALHADVKALADLLKTEFVTVLNLELPKSSEGDND